MPQKKDQSASGAAIAGAGVVTAGTGLAAGGVPGAKSDFSALFPKTPKHRAPVTGAKKVVRTVAERAPAVKVAPGGILGFRSSAHRGGHYGFQLKAQEDAKKKIASSSDAYWRGRNAGKIAPEEKIMRHMKVGRGAAGLALVGGSAAAAYGVKRSKVSKAQRHTEQYSGALAGAGVAGAGLSHGGSKVLDSQRRKWETTASRNVDDAGKLVPALAGREGKRLTLRQMHKHKTKNPGKPFPKSMYPLVSDTAIRSNPKLMSGVSPKTAEKAGQLRGAAVQGRHFAEVYGNTAKVVRGLRTPSLIVAGAGAGGLAMSRKKDTRMAKRLMSDAEIKHRKKVQGAVSRTTSTLGLGGLGLLGASAVARKNPGVLKPLRKIPALKTATPDKLRETAQNVGLVSGGIGGVGGYNFAAYTSAESRKRKVVSKAMDIAPMAGEVGFAKAWEPVGRTYDPESQRKARNQHQVQAAAGSATALAGSSVGAGALKRRYETKRGQIRPKNLVGEMSPKQKNWAENLGGGKKLHAKAVKAGKAQLGLGAAAVGALGVGTALEHKRRSQGWQSYSKRDEVSAWGINHND
jgi:hypothetical protein